MKDFRKINQYDEEVRAKNTPIWTITMVEIVNRGTDEEIAEDATPMEYSKTYYNADEACDDAEKLVDEYKDEEGYFQVDVWEGEYETPEGKIVDTNGMYDIFHMLTGTEGYQGHILFNEGTSNFKPMKEGFPLIVSLDPKCKFCPKCGYGNNNLKVDTCENCGADLSDVEPEVDDAAVEYFMEDLEKFVKNANDGQDFYKVSLEPGYYEGIQFYVTPKYGSDQEIINSWSGEDAKSEFGVDSIEEVIELKHMSREIVLKVLNQAKKELGMMELKVSARFSNGETKYNKVDEHSSVTCDRCRKSNESSSDIDNDPAYKCPYCGGHNCEFETIEDPEDGYLDGSTMTSYFSCNDCMRGYNVDFKIGVDRVYPLK